MGEIPIHVEPIQTRTQKEKLLFSTYTEVSDPKVDSLKSLVWKDLSGKNRRVIHR